MNRPHLHSLTTQSLTRSLRRRRIRHEYFIAKAERSGYSAEREGDSLDGREREACQNEETGREREGGSCALRAMDMSSESLDGTTFPRRPFGARMDVCSLAVGRWTP